LKNFLAAVSLLLISNCSWAQPADQLKLANQGDPNAQFYVGYILEVGQGVAKNPVQAAKWYERAAKQGNAKAQLRLGNMLEAGNGVQKNIAQAYFLTLLASTQLESAKKDATMLEGKLSKHIIARTQDQARNWKPRINPYSN
jgi:TPR repeat protein